MILGNKTNAGINEETEFVEIKNTVDFAYEKLRINNYLRPSDLLFRHNFFCPKAALCPYLPTYLQSCSQSAI